MPLSARASPRVGAAGDAIGAANRTGVSVKPVRNAVQILRLLSATEVPATLTTVVRQLQINPSTCLNILRTLVAEGVVDFAPSSKTYTIGDGIIDIAESVLARGGVDAVLKPHMEDIAQKFSVTVSLWRIIDDDRIRLELSVVGSGNLRIQMTPGQRLPRWVAAVGRVMAAHSGLSRKELQQRFNSLRWQNAPSFREYFNETQETLQRGWALDDGNFAKGVLSVSVPVFNRAGTMTMGCSATMFAGQHSRAVVHRLAGELRRVSRMLCRD